MITSIKIPARWRQRRHAGFIDDPVFDNEEGVAEFTLGEGPCGKTVVSLGVCFGTRGFVRVIQRCSDGTSQDFYYKEVDITGRIVVHNG